MSKLCESCEKTLGDEEFYKRSGGKLHRQCKRCCSIENAIEHCKRMIRRYEHRMKLLLAGRPVASRACRDKEEAGESTAGESTAGEST